MEVIQNNPKVSVCVVAYNQERYIGRCLQSIVDQETDFDFEVIVADDCSTDGTRAIVQNFVDKYPAVVKPIYHKNNIGAFNNYFTVHNAASGEYIAHIDGDDYIYQGKLFKQSKFLDKHRNCSLVAHRMLVVNAGRPIFATEMHKQFIDLQTLLLNHPMFLNSSTMYRKGKRGQIFPSDAGDYLDFNIYVRAALNGDIGFINEVLGEYTSNIGISCKRNLMPQIQAAIDLAEGFVSSKIVNIARSKQYLSYAVAELLHGNYSLFVEHVNAANRHHPKGILVFMFYHLKKMPLLIRVAVPVYKKLRYNIINAKSCHKDE